MLRRAARALGTGVGYLIVNIVAWCLAALALAAVLRFVG